MEYTLLLLKDLAAKIFTFDNLTFVLATFGSAGTAWGIIQNRKNN